MITRMSYVMDFFKKCSRQIGADIDDELSIVDDGHLFVEGNIGRLDASD